MAQGEKIGPVLTPMTEVFHDKPVTDHEPCEGTINNGIPGYPKGDGGVIDERVTFWQGGNFGKYKRDFGKE